MQILAIYFIKFSGMFKVFLFPLKIGMFSYFSSCFCQNLSKNGNRRMATSDSREYDRTKIILKAYKDQSVT